MGFFGTCVGLAGAIGALWLVRKWRERQWGECRNNKRLDGQIVIITGKERVVLVERLSVGTSHVTLFPSFRSHFRIR